MSDLGGRPLMLALVRLQRFEARKTFRTPAAAERLLAGVHAPMPVQMRPLAKRFRTDITRVWLVAGMHTHVHLQTRGLRKCFAAHLARERFVG